MITTVVLSALISISVNYGIHIYRTHEIKRHVNALEEKYSPLLEDCHRSFVILLNQIKKDKNEHYK